MPSLICRQCRPREARKEWLRVVAQFTEATS
jgi:hypothetical protein